MLFSSVLCLQTFSLLFSSIYATEKFMKKEYSLAAPYTHGRWDFSGDTIVSGQSIILTTNKQSQHGLLWNTHPVTMANWEAVVLFKIHGNDGTLFGDGLAFWYIDKYPVNGPVFGSHDHFRGLGVFLDTYSNHNGPHHHEHPYISAMINNGNRSYDHDTDGTHTQLAGCTARFRNKNHDTLVLIRYQNEVLTVLHDIENKGEWQACFEVPNVKLPTGYYFALSAATGGLSDNHEVVSLNAFDLGPETSTKEDRSHIEPAASDFEAERPHVDDDHKPRRWSDTLWTLFLVVVFAALCVAGVLGFMYYKKQQERHKRFY